MCSDTRSNACSSCLECDAVVEVSLPASVDLNQLRFHNKLIVLQLYVTVSAFSACCLLVFLDCQCAQTARHDHALTCTVDLEKVAVSDCSDVGFQWPVPEEPDPP